MDEKLISIKENIKNLDQEISLLKLHEKGDKTYNTKHRLIYLQEKRKNIIYDLLLALAVNNLMNEW